MLARLSAFVIWALVAATAVFWSLRLLVRAPAAPTYTVAVGESTAVRGDLTRLFGAPPVNAPVATVAPEASSRFKLLGIVAPKYQTDQSPAGHSVALIAIDGKMPKAFAVGSHVDGDMVLQSVSLRTVSIGLGQGAAPAITLELPLPTAAATGTLPIGGNKDTGFFPPTGTPVPQYGSPPVPNAGQPQSPPQFPAQVPMQPQMQLPMQPPVQQPPVNSTQ